MLTQAKREFIEFMMGADVLRFGEFKTKSGRMSPYFVNTGNYRTGSQIAALGKFYAACIRENCRRDFTAMFGPAYKGIPLVTAAAAALSSQFGIDKPYFFNRKEAKDHGEGGNLVGYQPKDGDKVIIIEDVTTSGKSIEETFPIITSAADIEIKGMIVSLNRLEKGKSGENKTALTEIQEKYGFRAEAIVTMEDVIELLYNQECNGKVVIDDEIKGKLDEYYKQYGI